MNRDIDILDLLSVTHREASLMQREVSLLDWVRTFKLANERPPFERIKSDEGRKVFEQAFYAFLNHHDFALRKNILREEASFTLQQLREYNMERAPYTKDKKQRSLKKQEYEHEKHRN